MTGLLEKRYPNLSFLLRFNEVAPPPFPIEKKPPLIKNLEKLEVLYVYGVGCGEAYASCKKWLAENKERDLIFLEEDLGALALFLEAQEAAEILDHPQVHLFFNLDKRKLDPFLQECAQAFPFEKIGIVAHPSYRKHRSSRFYRLRLKLHRLTTVQHALFLENHYYNLLSKNLLSNFSRWGNSFDGNALQGTFQGVPAIICGAGPSLENDLETLSGLTDQALIIAGGSAIPALTAHEISPHFGIALDPNPEEVERFRVSRTSDFPLLYASRLHPDVFQIHTGPHGYLRTGTGGPLESWLEDKLSLSSPPLKGEMPGEALSVTTIAVQFAATLGCSPIILVGVDLAFTEGKLYASGILSSSECFLKNRKEEVRSAERLLLRKDIDGKPVRTLVKWVMESSALSTFARREKGTTFINATSGGLGFPAIPNRPLSEIPLPSPQDLYKKVSQAIETHPLPASSSAISSHLVSLRKSVEEGEAYVSLILEELERVKGTSQDPETGKVIFAQMELEALDAYRCFLEETGHTLLPLLQRKYRPTSWGEENPSLKWHYLHSKWTAYQTLLKVYKKDLIRFIGNNLY